MTIPRTKVARHSLIADLLTTRQVRSQPALRDLLAEHGVDVTQATVSRDLLELGAVRLRGADGHLVYALGSGDTGEAATADERPPTARLARVVEELVVGVEASANLVVVRTPPGAAQFLASSIDHGDLPGVIGSVAGDDTVLLVTKDVRGGAAVAALLLNMTDVKR
jgi:transcriptional regulator of arginine metabolism